MMAVQRCYVKLERRRNSTGQQGAGGTRYFGVARPHVSAFSFAEKGAIEREDCGAIGRQRPKQ